jgi:hypothetical protein
VTGFVKHNFGYHLPFVEHEDMHVFNLHPTFCMHNHRL